MRWKPGFVFALILGCSVPAAAQGAAPETLDQLAPEIDALLAKYQTEAHIHGTVYGVVKDGRLAFVKGIGVQNLIDNRPEIGRAHVRPPVTNANLVCSLRLEHTSVLTSLLS